MNISDWPPHKALQLPDWCFRRFVVCCNALAIPVKQSAWCVSEIALPEFCVLWEVFIFLEQVDIDIEYARLLLGDQAPTEVMEANTLPELIPTLGRPASGTHNIYLSSRVPVHLVNMKTLLHTAGRRLILQTTALATKSANVTAVIVVSSLPTEVPDWLVSGHLRSR